MNGCFWHGHKNCAKTKGGRGSRVPKQNADLWRRKFVENRRRDARKCRELRALGFCIAIVWECELYDVDSLGNRLARFVGATG